MIDKLRSPLLGAAGLLVAEHIGAKLAPSFPAPTNALGKLALPAVMFVGGTLARRQGGSFSSFGRGAQIGAMLHALAHFLPTADYNLSAY